MKPLARGYIHQAAYYLALGACALLIARSKSNLALISNIIFCLSLSGLYGISTLYHCPNWSRQTYLLLRRIDHAAIFVLIAGSATPVCLIGIKGELGWYLFSSMWVVATIGMLITICWTHAPKWVRAILYLIVGWFAVIYFSDIKSAIGLTNMNLLLGGGITYTLGALVYALKRPNPFPRYFGYHEIFHLLVVIASGFHFIVIYRLTT